MTIARDPAVRELHYRYFRKGINDMSIFTHDDHVALMQQLPYVIGRYRQSCLLLCCSPALLLCCSAALLLLTIY